MEYKPFHPRSKISLYLFVGLLISALLDYLFVKVFKLNLSFYITPLYLASYLLFIGLQGLLSNTVFLAQISNNAGMTSNKLYKTQGYQAVMYSILVILFGLFVLYLFLY